MTELAPLAPPTIDSVQSAESASEAMIELHGVIKRFSNAAGVFTVLKGVDLTIARLVFERCSLRLDSYPTLFFDIHRV